MLTSGFAATTSGREFCQRHSDRDCSSLLRHAVMVIYFGEGRFLSKYSLRAGQRASRNMFHLIDSVDEVCC